MESILLLLAVSLIITFILALFYWWPRHIFHVTFVEKPSKLIPGQECPLPFARCSIRLSETESFCWNALRKSIFSVRDGRIRALSPGKTWLLCYIRTGRRFGFGMVRITVDDKPVFFQNKLLVHALGGLEDTFSYCNALEGLNQSLASHRPFLETDMILTCDNELVCSHGWKKKTYRLTGVPYPADHPVMSYQTFMQTRIQGKYTTIDAKKIADTMMEYPRLLLELDLRTLDREEASKTAKKIVEVFGISGNSHIADRMLIQVGSPQMYDGIDSIYHFPYYQYFVHRDEALDIEPVIRFCREKKIVSLAVKDTYLTPEIRKLAKVQGLCLLVYTVDDAQTAKQLLADGVDTVCSNFLKDSDLLI
jgi:glycerophosphoryl diester phosphodiesterase